jgi:uncharacterized protein YraI
MRFTLFLAAALALAGAFASPAEAAVTGYSARSVNIRSGPGTNFPVMATLGAGRQIMVEGCIRGWDWCEVRLNGRRGWVFSSLLSANYYSRRVSIAAYGARLGLPVISYNPRNYRDSYYRDGRENSCPCPRRGYWNRDRDYDDDRDRYYND